MWKQLYTLSVSVDLRDNGSIRNIAECLRTLRAPVLQDVTAQFRIFDKEFVYAAHDNDVKYVDACRELQGTLSEFPRKHLSFRGSSELPARKHLWTRELGQLFPALRDLNILTISSESSEIFIQSRPPI